MSDAQAIVLLIQARQDARKGIDTRTEQERLTALIAVKKFNAPIVYEMSGAVAIQ